MEVASLNPFKHEWVRSTLLGFAISVPAAAVQVIFWPSESGPVLRRMLPLFTVTLSAVVYVYLLSLLRDQPGRRRVAVVASAMVLQLVIAIGAAVVLDGYKTEADRIALQEHEESRRARLREITREPIEVGEKIEFRLDSSGGSHVDASDVQKWESDTHQTLLKEDPEWAKVFGEPTKREEMWRISSDEEMAVHVWHRLQRLRDLREERRYARPPVPGN